MLVKVEFVDARLLQVATPGSRLYDQYKTFSTTKPNIPGRSDRCLPDPFVRPRRSLYFPSKPVSR